MSLDKGLNRGMQYFADYLRCISVAAKTGAQHPEQLNHLLASVGKVAEDWLKEAAGVKGIDAHGDVTNALLLALVIGDPFEGSRHDVQALKAELGVK